MKNIWKIAIVILVFIVAAIIIVPKMVGTGSDNGSSGAAGDGSSLATIEKTIGNGKPTLLLLRSDA